MTPDELFPPSAVASDSPRLRWQRDHDVRTQHCPWITAAPWCAWLRKNDNDDDPDGNGKSYPVDPKQCGYGMTEEEAEVDLCARLGLKGWATP